VKHHRIVCLTALLIILAALAGCGPKKTAETTTTTTTTAPAAGGAASTEATAAPAPAAGSTGAPTAAGSTGAAPASGTTSAATSPSQPSPGPVPPGMKGMKVAVMLTGPHLDGGWNQSAWEGGQRLQTDGASVLTMENLKDAQFGEQYHYLAKSGYKLIFGHGDEFGPAAAKAAAQFPNVVFVTTGGEKSGANLIPLHFATEEGSYLQGMEAAMVSKSGKGGFVGGQELPPVAIAAKAFALGAKAVNPAFDFKIAYINSWDDQTHAKAQTDAFLNNGVDVIAHNCDAAAKGMFDTAGAKPGVYTFGVNADENGKAPNVLSSVFLDIPKAFEDVGKEVAGGTVVPGARTLGLKSNDIRLIDNPNLASVIPADGKAKITQAQQDIEAGKIKVTGP
jgi:basic membrane protein A